MNATALRYLAGAVLILGSVPAVTTAQEGELRLSSGGKLTVRFQGSQIIGRAESCSLDLKGVPEERYIQLSRLHAALVADAGRWSVTDLGSTNGTFVNERRLAAWAPEPLVEGDLVGIAGFTFTFHIPKDRAAVAQKFDPMRQIEFGRQSDLFRKAVEGARPALYIRVSSDPTEDFVE